MPQFEYVCDKCGKKKEFLIPNLTDFSPGPACCGQPMRRLYGSFGFMMK